MSDTLRSSRHPYGPAALIVGFVLFATAAEAGQHHARLSKDLESRITAARGELTTVIVSGTDEDVRALAEQYGAVFKKSLRGGGVLEVTGGQLEALADDPSVDHLSGDARVQRMSVTTETTGATQVWSGIAGLNGYTGQGIGVVVIDSGVATHAALKGRVVAELDFTGKKSSVVDRYGHGTHVAGIVAGNDTGDYAGIAPGAHIVSLRVLGADGSGDTSDVINAIDWAIENKAKYALRIINLSLGHPVFESYRDDPLCQAVQRAVDAGMVVVAAAGNLGKTEDGRPIVGGVISPGNSPAALTVGALNTMATAQRSDDVMASYSSRGPTYIDGVLKPDIAAPGNKIAGPAAPGAYITQTYPERIVSGEGSQAYIELSGTSMAAAVVSGAAALMLEANPALTPADTKLVLQLTSSPVAGAGLVEAGAGSLNAAAAVVLGAKPGTGFTEITIGGEDTRYSFLAFGSAIDSGYRNQIASDILVWGNALDLPDGSAVDINADILVWGSGLVWGNILVWGSNTVTSDILVWGSTVTSDILVWGNILVWGSVDVNADILVWGSSSVLAD
jgi:serine protease AprX